MKKNKIVSWYWPDAARDSARVAAYTLSPDSPYELCTLLADSLINQPHKVETKRIKRKTLLSAIWPIHNVEGLRDRKQIVSMVNKIKSGSEVFHSTSELPNVRLIETPDGKNLLLFDGHHTALAYVVCGYRYLEELPHIIIRPTEGSRIDIASLMPLFPASASNRLEKDWSSVVVNWQKPAGEQIESRKIKSLTELAIRSGLVAERSR